MRTPLIFSSVMIKIPGGSIRKLSSGSARKLGLVRVPGANTKSSRSQYGPSRLTRH